MQRRKRPFITDLIILLPMMLRDILMHAPCDQSQRRERSHSAACHGLAMIPDLGATLRATAGDTAAVPLCYGSGLQTWEETSWTRKSSISMTTLRIAASTGVNS